MNAGEKWLPVIGDLVATTVVIPTAVGDYPVGTVAEVLKCRVDHHPEGPERWHIVIIVRGTGGIQLRLHDPRMIVKLPRERLPEGATLVPGYYTGRPATQVRRVHHLKTHPRPFHATRLGDKTYEIRVNDRDYQVGDILLLQEWRPPEEAEPHLPAGYTGLECMYRVRYMTPGGEWGLPPNLCVLALGPV